jgi:hypothetical protein
MDILKAVATEIGKLNQPIVTLYQIAVIVFRLYKAGSYKGQKLNRIKKTRASRSDCSGIIKDLVAVGILGESRSVPHSHVFSVLGKEQGEPREVICSIDPFGYISHLSAMEWHGLTDRVSRTLFYSSPPLGNWNRHAWTKMQKDIGEEGIQDYLTQQLPKLTRLNINRIGRVSVHRYSSEHLGAFTSIQGRPLRVSTIGRTFLDMIREPNLCGGIHHVLDVYEQHAERYLSLIIDETDRHGRIIDKVRVGYVLDERIGLHDSRINAWTKFIQRGGSRKLDAGSPYSPEHSQKWCLSTNVEG